MLLLIYVITKFNGGDIILFQCNFIIGVLSSAAVVLGNVQLTKLPENSFQNAYTRETRSVMIREAYEENYAKAECEDEVTSGENEEDQSAKEYEEYYEPEAEETEETEETEIMVDAPEVESVFYSGFDSSFKAYMDYRCITDTSSVQYDMQQQAYTDDRGFRKIGDDYCVALGTGFTNGCGERFVIYLDSGYSFTAIVSDVKSDMHTDDTHCYVPRGEGSGNVVEFLIDGDYAEDAMLSSGNAGYYDDLSGNVIAVEGI